MATDENNHKNEARDDWTGCTFRVERGPSDERRAECMADLLADVRRRVWPARPGFSPRRPARDQARPRRRLTAPTAPTDGAPLEITMRRTVDLCAFLELPEEARALVIAAKKREFGPMEE